MKNAYDMYLAAYVGQLACDEVIHSDGVTSEQLVAIAMALSDVVKHNAPRKLAVFNYDLGNMLDSEQNDPVRQAELDAAAASARHELTKTMWKAVLAAVEDSTVVTRQRVRAALEAVCREQNCGDVDLW